jgi:uncharacterized small protein (DUF1192 family)
MRQNSPSGAGYPEATLGPVDTGGGNVNEEISTAKEIEGQLAVDSLSDNELGELKQEFNQRIALLDQEIAAREGLRNGELRMWLRALLDKIEDTSKIEEVTGPDPSFYLVPASLTGDEQTGLQLEIGYHLKSEWSDDDNEWIISQNQMLWDNFYELMPHVDGEILEELRLGLSRPINIYELSEYTEEPNFKDRLVTIRSERDCLLKKVEIIEETLKKRKEQDRIERDHLLNGVMAMFLKTPDFN